MSNLLNVSPLYLPPPRLGTKATTDKGKQIMEGLLLNQYQNSPNLKEYMMAYIAELDLLFEQIEEVYLGRFIQNAVGRQLDVIGIILQQSRAVILPNIWFGFSDAGLVPPEVDKMADEATPADGGLFRDENVEAVITPLDDITYRRVLLAKALCVAQESATVDLAYYVIQILLNRIPTTFELVNVAHRAVELRVPVADVTGRELELILYMAQYFVPAGITFTINRI